MNNGFNFDLTINKIETVTPRASGESEIDGIDVVWGYAVKFTSKATETVDDKDFGEKDVESVLEVEIACSSKLEVRNLNDFLRKQREEKVAFKCETTLPRYANKLYKCKAKLTGNDFITHFLKDA